MRFNRSQKFIWLTAVLVLLLALAACGGAEEPTATPVPPPTETPVPPPPTDTPVPPPTDTPVPEPTATLEPTATSVPEVELQAFVSEEAGLAINYPVGWFSGGLPGFYTFAANEEDLMTESPGTAGPVALLVSGPTADFTSTDPVEAISQVIDEFQLGDNDTVIEAPTAFSANGQDGAYTIIDATTDTGDEITAYVALVVNGDYAAILVGAVPKGDADGVMATYAAMAKTIEVSEPTAVVSDIGTTTDMGTMVTEGMLLYGDTVDGTITKDGPSAWNFIGLEGESVDLIVEPQGDLDVVVDIYDETGASILDFPVDNSFGVEEIANLIIPSDGTFTIAISGYDGATGDYTLTLIESGSAPTVGESSGTVTYSEFMAGSVDGATESLWTFEAKGGEFIDVTVSPTTDGLDVVVDILDENGRSLLSEPLDESYDTEYIRILPIPADGLYTISVTSYDGTPGDFDLLIEESYLSQPASFIFAFGELADAEEVHEFPFYALADDLVIAQVDPVELEFDVVLQIYNGDTEELIEEVDATTGFEELLFTVPEDGNYYFQVVGFEGSTGTYDITLIGSDLVTFETAVGDQIIGRFGPAGFIEYTIRVDAGDTINLMAKTEDEIDLILQISDFDNNILAEVDDGFTSEGEELSYTFEETDEYIIRISDFFASGSGKFVLSID